MMKLPFAVLIAAVAVGCALAARAGERDDLEAALDKEFRKANGATIDGLLSEDRDEFQKAVRAAWVVRAQYPPGDERDVRNAAECLLFAFHRARGKGWREGSGMTTMYLEQEWPEKVRARISDSVGPVIRDRDIHFACSAVRILAWCGRDVHDEIRKLVDDPRREIRHIAMMEISRLLVPADTPWVAAFLKSGDPAMRQFAILGLVQLKAVGRAEEIAQLTKDPMYYVRRHAISALGRLGANQHAALVASFLDDETAAGADARSWAFEALRSIRSRDAEEKVVELLRHDDADVRMHAAQLLGTWRAKDWSGSCVELFGDREERVRVAAVDAIGAMGDAKWAEAVGRLLDDRVPAVRESAAAGLGYLQARGYAKRILGMHEDGLVGKNAVIWSLIHMNAEDQASMVGALVGKLAQEQDEKWLPADKQCIPSARPYESFQAIIDLAASWRNEDCFEKMAEASFRAPSRAQWALIRAVVDGNSVKGEAVFRSKLADPDNGVRETAGRVIAWIEKQRTGQE